MSDAEFPGGEGTNVLEDASPRPAHFTFDDTGLSQPVAATVYEPRYRLAETSDAGAAAYTYATAGLEPELPVYEPDDGYEIRSRPRYSTNEPFDTYRRRRMLALLLATLAGVALIGLIIVVSSGSGDPKPVKTSNNGEQPKPANQDLSVGAGNVPAVPAGGLGSEDLPGPTSAVAGSPAPAVTGGGDLGALIGRRAQNSSGTSPSSVGGGSAPSSGGSSPQSVEPGTSQATPTAGNAGTSRSSSRGTSVGTPGSAPAPPPSSGGGGGSTGGGSSSGGGSAPTPPASSGANANSATSSSQNSSGTSNHNSSTSSGTPASTGG